VPFEAYIAPPALQLDSILPSGLFKPFSETSPGSPTRWNIDGLLTYATDFTGARVVRYSLIFRTGVYEGVSARWFNAGRDVQRLNPDEVELSLIRGLANPLEVLRRLGVQPPLAILISIVGAQNYLVPRETLERRLPTPQPGWKTIDRNVVNLPDVVFDEYCESRNELPILLRPAIDAFWQAGGWPRSPNYNANGTWEE